MMPRILTRQKAPQIIKCVSFILVFTLVLLAFSNLFFSKSGSADGKSQNSLARGFYVEPKNSLDIIAIGNSDIECSFSPMELWKEYGYTGYTCGEPEQTIYESYNLLQEVMICQKPKVVILEADGLFPHEDPAKTFNRFLDSRLYLLFPAIEYHNLWKMPVNLSTEPTKGYLFKSLDMPVSQKHSKSKTEITDKISPVALAQMGAFQNLCKKSGARLVLVYSPTAYSWSQKRHERISKYAAANGLPFIDLNIDSAGFNIDWKEDTWDTGYHLNYCGAKMSTQYLGRYLHRHYSIPDHRKDSAYKQWNSDYIKYVVTIKHCHLRNAFI